MSEAAWPVTADLSGSEAAGLARALTADNRAVVGEEGHRPLGLAARDSAGGLLAGLVGASYWGWLRVDVLWVAGTHRRMGLGRALLEAAEAEARARACRGVWLDTFSFQFPDFYRRAGYAETTRLPDYPPGHERLFLAKALDAPHQAPEAAPRSYAIMGIVNVTPDSFSDGGAFADPVAAVAHAERLAHEGADLLDVGGESTRPGAEPVPAEAERARVLPVVEGIAARGLDARISIDTTKRAVAESAVEAGASYVNDVTAFRHDPELAGLVADRGLDCCLMHMLGEPRTMQDAPRYDDVVSDVKAFLEARLAFATAEGIAEERIHLDPGIGFGKTLEHNLELLRRLPELAALGRPLMFGVSRKRFLGTLTGREVGERTFATVAANVLAYERGATVFRVHDVASTRDGLAVANATLPAQWPGTTQRNTTTTT